MRLSKRFFKSRSVQGIIAGLAAGYVRFVHKTTRWTIEETAEAKALRLSDKGFVVCFWHGRMLLISPAWDGVKPIHMLISAHSDGVMISRAVSRLGIETIKGSSKKGGMSALRSMQRLLEQGRIVGVTPDGPRGPRMQAKSGAIKAAQMAGTPIMPMTGNISRRRILKSWDRFCLPLPFARGVVYLGTPIVPATSTNEEEMERYRQLLEERLNALTAESDRYFGQTVVEPADART